MNKATETHEVLKRLKQLAIELERTPTQMEFEKSGVTRWSMGKAGGFLQLLKKAGLSKYNPYSQINNKKVHKQPKVLVLDIETLPMVVYSWDLFPERIGLEQIIEDWSVASWSAKWLGEDEIFYMDVRNNSLADIRNDKDILMGMWKLIDEAEVIVTQNGKAFDIKKLNARFLKHQIKPTATFRHYDTKEIAKRYFKFTSNRLAYMTEEFNTLYKKLEHANFPGFKLWLGCMAGNEAAWIEMEEYNKHDVLSLEEFFMLILPWDKTINWNIFHDELNNVCSCGHTEFHHHKKEKTTNAAVYSRVICNSCGKEHFIKDNLLMKMKRDSILR